MVGVESQALIVKGKVNLFLKLLTSIVVSNVISLNVCMRIEPKRHGVSLDV